MYNGLFRSSWRALASEQPYVSERGALRERTFPPACWEKWGVLASDTTPFPVLVEGTDRAVGTGPQPGGHGNLQRLDDAQSLSHSNTSASLTALCTLSLPTYLSQLRRRNPGMRRWWCRYYWYYMKQSLLGISGSFVSHRERLWGFAVFSS